MPSPLHSSALFECLLVPSRLMGSNNPTGSAPLNNEHLYFPFLFSSQKGQLFSSSARLTNTHKTPCFLSRDSNLLPPGRLNHMTAGFFRLHLQKQYCYILSGKVVQSAVRISFPKSIPRSPGVGLQFCPFQQHLKKSSRIAPSPEKENSSPHVYKRNHGVLLPNTYLYKVL